MIISEADAILHGKSFAADIVHLEEPVYSPEKQVMVIKINVEMDILIRLIQFRATTLK